MPARWGDHQRPLIWTATTTEWKYFVLLARCRTSNWTPYFQSVTVSNDSILLMILLVLVPCQLGACPDSHAWGWSVLKVVPEGYHRYFFGVKVKAVKIDTGSDFVHYKNGGVVSWQTDRRTNPNYSMMIVWIFSCQVGCQSGLKQHEQPGRTNRQQTQITVRFLTWQYISSSPHSE